MSFEVMGSAFGKSRKGHSSAPVQPDVEEEYEYPTLEKAGAGA